MTAPDTPPAIDDDSDCWLPGWWDEAVAEEGDLALYNNSDAGSVLMRAVAQLRLALHLEHLALLADRPLELPDDLDDTERAAAEAAVAQTRTRRYAEANVAAAIACLELSSIARRCAGTYLEAARREGLSVRQLAELADMPPATVQRWTQHRDDPGEVLEPRRWANLAAGEAPTWPPEQ